MDIDYLQKFLRLNTRDFAKLLGVDVRNVYRWKSSRSEPTNAAKEVLIGIEESLKKLADRHPCDTEKIVLFIKDAVNIGGLSYLIIKLLDLVTDDIRASGHPGFRASGPDDI